MIRHSRVTSLSLLFLLAAACGSGSSGEPPLDAGSEPSPPSTGSATRDAGASPDAATSTGGEAGVDATPVGPSTHPQCGAFEAACGSPPGTPDYSRTLCEGLFDTCKNLGHPGVPAYISCVLGSQCSNQACSRLKDNCTGG